MRLLYVCDALAILGGLERVLIEKANWFAEQGNYDVFLITANQGNQPICFPLHPNVRFKDLGMGFYKLYRFPRWWRLAKIHQLHRFFRKRLKYEISETVPDIIICTRIDYLRDVVCVKGNIPLVFESHSGRLACRFEGDGIFRRLYIWYLQQAVKKVQMVVALTKGDANEWRKMMPNVCVIPNVVHLNVNGSYSDCTAKSVIFVGRFSRQKDVSSLLRVWNLIFQRHPDWCLHIYGGYGEEQSAMLAEIKKSDANIHVHEPTLDIIKKYKECSILLLTSLYEPFGLVLPEAMSCGLPVVAFDCPYGPADIITNGVDGFLIESMDINSYVDKVCLLIENEALRQKMGRIGKYNVQRYEANHIMPKWIKLLDNLLSVDMSEL